MIALEKGFSYRLQNGRVRCGVIRDAISEFALRKVFLSFFSSRAFGFVGCPGSSSWIMMLFCLPFCCSLLIIRAINKLPNFIWEVTAAHLSRDRE